MRGVARGRGTLDDIRESATRLGFLHYVERMGCTACEPCVSCQQLLLELLRDLVFWKGQAKTAIKRRDELDQTILAIDGGVGHWRRECKQLSTLLNMTRNELNALRDPVRYRRASERQLDEHAARLVTRVAAAIDREEDVERRIGRARDVLYELQKSVGVDTPAGRHIKEAWSTL